MANVKKAYLREKIIDQCLQSPYGYSTLEIMRKCNDALETRGEMRITSLNTIRNDIRSIESRFNIMVEEVRIGREIKYRYADPSFSIYNSPLTPDDIQKLSESISILRRFSGTNGSEWIDELEERLNTTVSASSHPVVGFQDNLLFKGKKWFSPLFNAITEHHALLIGYKPYQEKFQDITIHPYYLKQYNQRWFLFAYDEQNQRISNYALDRIQYTQVADVKYRPNTTIDFEHYFDNAIGATVIAGAEPELITIRVDGRQLPYILSKPLHRTQEVIQKNEDGSAVITIRVILNFELEQLLLSFGERVTVTAPELLRQKIYDRIKKNLKNYE